MQKIRWTILVVGVIVLLAAMIQNSENVALKLFFYETQLPLAVVLLVTSAASFLIGAITIGRMLKRSAKAKLKPVTEKPSSEGPKPKTTPFS